MKKSKVKEKKAEKKEIEELITAQIDEDEDQDDDDGDFEVTPDVANIAFKFIFENARKKKNQTIEMDELWSIIKGKKECKDKKINKLNKLKNICSRLEDEGKIFISENNEITLI